MCKEECQSLMSRFQQLWLANSCTERDMVELVNLTPAKTATHCIFQPYGAYKILKITKKLKVHLMYESGYAISINN